MTTHKSPQEVADEKRDREDEEYTQMYDQVAAEMVEAYRAESGPWPEKYVPDGREVHAEAMRRLKQSQTY